MPVTAAGRTDTSQGKSALVHRGGYEHGGYILPTPSGVPPAGI